MKNPKGELTKYLPLLLHETENCGNRSNRVRKNYVCLDFTFQLNLDSNFAHSKIILDAFIPIFDSLHDLEIVFVESQQHDLQNIFFEKSDDGDLFLKETINSDIYVGIDRAWNAVYFLDRKRKIAGVWATDLKNIPLGSFITPIRVIFSWFLEIYKIELVHAAAIGIDGKGILISGESGSGKSTLAFSAAINSFSVVGDDAVLVSENTIKALYKNGKIEPNSPLFPLHNHKFLDIGSSLGSKVVVPLIENGFNFSESLPLHGIVLPRISDKSQISRMTRSEIAKEFIPQSMREILGGTKNNLNNLFRIVNTYPFFRLDLSENLEENLEKLVEISSLT